MRFDDKVRNSLVCYNHPPQLLTGSGRNASRGSSVKVSGCGFVIDSKKEFYLAKLKNFSSDLL